MSELQQKANKNLAEKILKTNFGIEGDLMQLVGEIDANFAVLINGVKTYTLKISPLAHLDSFKFQTEILKHLPDNDIQLTLPKPIADVKGDFLSESIENDKKYIARLLTWIPGRLMAQVNPILPELLYDLGKKSGEITKKLQNFRDPFDTRKLDWDIAQGTWCENFLDLFEFDQREILQYYLALFRENLATYKELRKSVVHNDLNENNIIVSYDKIHPQVVALIDFGDAVYTQTINDLAIACAYGMMDFPDPLSSGLTLVKGYHESFPLEENELAHLYCAVAIRLVISVTKSGINRKEYPENTYLQISEKQAWDLLKKWRNIDPDFAHYSFRQACGFEAHPNENLFKNWARQQDFSLSDLFPTTTCKNIHLLDLSVSSEWIGHLEDYNDLDLFQFKIDQLQKVNPDKVIAGGYLEPRPIYTSDSYDKIGNNGKESRTIHLGIDFWLPARTPVAALFDGEIVTAVNDEGNKEYGGLLILKHCEQNLIFYTLYGHLTVTSALKYSTGDLVKKGEQIAELGSYPENGNWASHLHFQIMLSMLNYTIDFPGVTYKNQLNVWKSICPDPNLLFQIDGLKTKYGKDNDSLLSFRKKYIGKSLSLQYKNPLQIVRGQGPYLIDPWGKKYLDTLNNVAHVGHEHIEVVNAGRMQMALLNTNTRYLHKNINELAEILLSTFPPELNVVHFVNSGSEANELALRMAKTATNGKGFIASEVGYHGNTNACIDISSYKFDGKGGKGKPDYVEIFPLPDAFRGKFRGENTGEFYAQEVEKCIQNLKNKNIPLAGMIIESIISCGGQIELPEGFLQKSFDLVRAQKGTCIIDEVQVGCGRVGKTFWGFQLHNVIPDIVTIGKPLGNGHPLAAVVCTAEIAEKFANGMEFFNTFGGNPVSCAIGSAVLKMIKNENLQENALKVGDFLKNELKQLAKDFPIIGDVRGQGLFLGFELVNSQLQPLEEQTTYLINRMKEFGILLSSDGPDHNVIKIKPPMVFSIENAIEFLFYLRKVFAEDFMKLT
ncbi:aminotransferase class III-fold pyridoxal phosphate-dependent enzyme [Namhaeicola litoreus]|uniref:Aminotransferase class III-fold pyridoxal phosphate-dependent enzyme n=1 Tax=Namhaeicola litoreus TaxID=1052145 RepID=A0ABW3XYK6_9FLAO